MTVFGSVVDLYDDARPSYPPALYAALGPLRGRYVLDAGTGTGIAARELIDRVQMRGCQMCALTARQENNTGYRSRHVAAQTAQGRGRDFLY